MQFVVTIPFIVDEELWVVEAAMGLKGSDPNGSSSF